MNTTDHSARLLGLLTIGFAYSLFAFASFSLADGTTERKNTDNSQTTPSAEDKEQKVQNKDRTLFETGRLYPGESVKTDTGKTMKIWSTRGSVTAEQAPTAPSPNLDRNKPSELPEIELELKSP